MYGVEKDKAKLEQAVAWFSERGAQAAPMTQEAGMWPRLPASVIRTGWGSAEDILQRLWDFPCGSNAQPPRTLVCMKGRVLEDKQVETGKVLSPSLRPLAKSSGPHRWRCYRACGLLRMRCFVAYFPALHRVHSQSCSPEPMVQIAGCFCCCSALCHIHARLVS